MVTEILRPNSNTQPIAISATNITTYPTLEDINDLEILINEETADDDSTYLQCLAVLTGPWCYFDSELLRNSYSEISSINLVARIKADVSTTRFLYSIITHEGTTVIRPLEGSAETQTKDWETISIILDKDTVISAIEYNIQNAEDSPLIIELQAQKVGTDSKTKVDLCITQVYIEVTYSDGSSEDTTEMIHLKENGTWTSVPCTIYQKQSGAWVLTDSTVFNNGDNFILQQIT
jgi:hypothetical protein